MRYPAATGFCMLILLAAVSSGCTVSADNYVLQPARNGTFRARAVHPGSITLDDADRLYVRLFNGDDIQTVFVNGAAVVKIHDSVNSGWVDITGYLDHGENTLAYSLENTMTLVSYGFQVKINDEIVINRVGGAAKGAHRNGGIDDNTAFPVGEVMRLTIPVNWTGFDGHENERDAPTEHSLSASLYLYEPFDGHINADAVEFEHVEFPNGKFGSCLAIPEGKRSNYDVWDDFLQEATIMVWVKPDDLEKRIAFWYYDRNYPCAVYYPDHSYKLSMFFLDNEFRAAPGAKLAQSLEPDRFYHLVQSWGPAGFKAYLNGNLIFHDTRQLTGITDITNAPGAPSYPPRHQLTLGNNPNGSDGSPIAGGSYDDFAIFQRQLTDATVATIANSAQPLSELLDQIPDETEPTGDYCVDPETLEKITAFPVEASIHQPQVARVGGTLRLFYGYRYGHPGAAGVGYLDLNDNGTAVDMVKHTLAEKGGYTMIHTPFYDNGTLYTTSYYIWRAGEWAMYLTEAPLTVNDDGSLTMGETRELLTGSDRADGHWMGRDVQYGSIVRNSSSMRLYFDARSWYPNNSQPSHVSLGFIEKDGHSWSEPQEVIFPGVEGGHLPASVSGFRVIPLDGGDMLYCAVENHANNRRDIVLYRCNRDAVTWKTVLLSEDDILLYIDEPEDRVESFRFGAGLDIAEIEGTTWLYFTVGSNIYRAELLSSR